MLCALLIIVEYMLFSFPINGARKKVYTKEFMEEHFKEEHEKAFPGESVPKSGYPDTIGGRYAEKLSYKDWYVLACADRVHLNFYEMITQLLTCILIGGLVNPWPVVACAGIHILARILYLYLYLNKGPDGRRPAAMLILFSTLALLILAIMAPIQIAVKKASDGIEI